VWEAIRDDTTQIFQWEGNTGNDYIKKLLSDENIKRFSEINANVDRMTLLSIGNSAIRPAGASYREDLASGVVRKIGSAAIDEFLSSTFGYLVFQEQIIEFLHSYCGFTMGEADIVRRHFAKKTGTEDDIPVIKSGGYLKDEKGNEKTEHYIDGYIETMKKKYNMPNDKAEESIEAFLQVIIDASFYLFSLNHSQPYSYEGYVSGYLRTYYMIYFLTAAFNINQGKEEKTLALTQFAKKNDIQIKNPVFRHSKGKYYFDTHSNSIYKGIGSLKYFNTDVADELFELRNNKFNDFIDLLVTLKSDTSINSRQLAILIKIDYFKEFGDINDLLYYNDMFDALYGKKQLKKDKLISLGLSEEYVRKCSQKESDKTFTGLNAYLLLKDLLNVKKDKCNIFERIDFQREFLGYIDIVDKKCAGIVSVINVDVKYTPKITLYAIANGNTLDVMVDKRTFAKNPIEIGQMLKIKNQFSKPRQTKNEEGKWIDVPDTKVWWLTDYRKASNMDILA
jgi:DNA polymerase-3 subunit alpha